MGVGGRTSQEEGGEGGEGGGGGGEEGTIVRGRRGCLPVRQQTASNQSPSLRRLQRTNKLTQ